MATADEVAELVTSALNFTCANHHSGGAEAQTIVVYAWNESSENGAAIIPSLGNATAYIDALNKVLPMKCNDMTNVYSDAETKVKIAFA